MKAIILAAGMGTRLGKYTENLPKGMLNFNGKTLIERQIEVLRQCGVNDITVVKGYMPEKIQLSGVKYYENKDFANTNMVETLFCAEEEMDGDIVVCYSDIIYEPRILQEAIDSPVDIGVVADTDYLEYWKTRLDNWQDDVESFVIRDGKVIELGETHCTPDKAQVRIVGIVKYSHTGVEALKKVYHENKEKYYAKDEPWLRSKSFKKAYTTCMLQAMINAGYRVDPVLVSRGWMEFDTVEDYEKAVQWNQEGTLKRFIDIN